MKRKVCLLLCALLCILSLTVTAYAENQEPTMLWSFDEGILRVGCQGKMDLSAGIPWESFKPEITEVCIDAGTTSVGPAAFSDCALLTSVKLPDGITAIEKDAFHNSAALCWITLPEELAEIQDGAFQGCKGLKTVVIPKGVSSIDEKAFDSTTRIRGYTGSAAEDYARSRGCTFSSCGTYLGKGAENAWNDDISWKLDGYGTLILSGKGQCPQGALPWEAYRADIRAVKVESGITNLPEAAFKNCRKLKNVELPEGLESVGSEAFLYCARLQEIRVPDSVQKFGDRVFNPDVVILCGEKTAAHSYALERELEVQTIAAETGIIPEETEAPEVAEVPETTEVPEATEAPAETEPPEETAVPSETEAPEETEAPAETEAPEETAVPEETEAPEEQETPRETEPETGIPVELVLSSGEGKPGQTVELNLSIGFNPGLCGLSFTMKYDGTALSLKGYRCDKTLKLADWTMGEDRALWVSADPWTNSGAFLTLTFLVDAEATEDALVELVDVVMLDAEGKVLPVKTQPGTVLLKTGLLGDVNGDGVLTGQDSKLLRQHLVGIITLDSADAADLNRDGAIDPVDALLLEKLLKVQENT